MKTMFLSVKIQLLAVRTDVYLLYSQAQEIALS